MKKEIKLISTAFAIWTFLVLMGAQAFGQFKIRSSDLPSEFGILIINEDDISHNVQVDVGFPGNNQTWRLNQPYQSVLTRLEIVNPDSTPFRALFPNANIAIRYKGRLGNMINSYYFDDVSGRFYGYENLTDTNLMFYGFGSDSAFAQYGEFFANFKGSIDIQPDVILHSLPLAYGNSWKAVSNFSVKADTVFYTTPVKILATIKDSLYNIVDGAGDIILPTASYKCLRVKSYLTLEEKLYMNNVLLRSRKSRTINYYWVAQKYGIVARVISYGNEADDRFVQAKQVSRLHKFDPQIGLAMDQISGKRGQIFNMPIQISDLTDLDVRAVCLHVVADTNILKPQGIVCTGTMTQAWTSSSCSMTADGILINLKGNAPLTGQGCLCYIKYLVNPKAIKNGLTPVRFQKITITEKGPKIRSVDGRFILLPGNLLAGQESGTVESSVPIAFQLSQNYPNPFNPTTTIEYQLPEAAQVILNVFDVQGHLVRNLMHDSQNAGYYQLIWDGCDDAGARVASGAYFYRLEAKTSDNAANAFIDARTMMLLK